MSAYGDLNPGVAGLIVTQYPKIDSGIVQEAMTPGTPVFGYANSGNKVWKLKADVSKIVVDGDLSASNSTVVTVNGIAATAVVYGTSHAATMTAILAQIRLVTGAAVPNGVEAALDPADTNGRTILVRTKGVTSTVSAATTGGTARTWTATNGFFGQVFRGILALQHCVPTTVGGTASFAKYDAAPVVYDADLWALAASGVDSNEKGFVSVSTGVLATSGQDVGIRTIVSRNSDGVAVVRVPSAPVALTYADSF